MATKRSPRVALSATVSSRRADIVRQQIAVALLRAISVQGATNAQAARWLGISERTMFAWAHGERPINVETVLACKQLGHQFRVALCAFDHSRDSAPYLAKKSKR